MNKRPRKNRKPALLSVLALALFISGCSRADPPATPVQLAGNPHNGQHLIYTYACGSCHTIPGIAEATGTIGPNLSGFASRTYIAGSLINEPSNLYLWIANPQKVVTGNAMPNLGVSEQQARDIAAYLYTLR